MLCRPRGGNIWRRDAVAVPVESDDKVGNSLSASLPEPEAKKGLLNAYLRLLDKRPLPTKIITSGVICAIGDVMAQALAFVSSGVSSVTLGGFMKAFEFKRFIIYGMLGAAWIAPIVHYWFNALEDLFKGVKVPDNSFSGKMGKALKMVVIDQTIGAPIVNAG